MGKVWGGIWEGWRGGKGFKRIWELLGKYLEGLSDGTRHADLDKLYADWGLLEDDLMAPLRYCAIAKSWNSGISPGTMAGDSFIKRFLEVKQSFFRSNPLLAISEWYDDSIIYANARWYWSRVF